MKRRRFHQGLLTAAAAYANAGKIRAQAKDTKDKPTKGWPLGVCDWTLGKRHELAAFDFAAKLGLGGVQVSFSEPGSPNDLREAKSREALFAHAEMTGVKVASLGMGILNQRPYASDPDSPKWVAEAIDVVAAMKKEFPKAAPSVVLLAFFGKGDVNDKPEALQSVIAHLRKVAPAAEEAGVVFGIESLLDKDDHLRILDGVGSPAVQVYYDTANSHRMGYNIYAEVAELGAERICQIHAKENGTRIGEGKIDFARFRRVLDKIGYQGWLILEGSRIKGNDLADDYRANSEALRRFFGAGKLG